MQTVLVAPRNDEALLLPVIRQNLRTGLAQPLAVLLQTLQNNLVALVHQRPAKARHIPRTSGIGPAALRERRGDDQEKRDGEQKSGHRVTFTTMRRTQFKMAPQPIRPAALRRENSPIRQACLGMF